MHANHDWTPADSPLPDPLEDPAGGPADATAERSALDLLGFLADFRAGLGTSIPSSGDAIPYAEPSRSRFAPMPEPEPWVEDPYAGSGRQVAPDWWQASDGKWYAPELHPDRPVEVPAPEPGANIAACEPQEPESRSRRATSRPAFRRLRHRGPATA